MFWFIKDLVLLGVDLLFKNIYDDDECDLKV